MRNCNSAPFFRSSVHILLFLSDFPDFSDFPDMVGEGLDDTYEGGEIRLEKYLVSQKLWRIKVGTERKKN